MFYFSCVVIFLPFKAFIKHKSTIHKYDLNFFSNLSFKQLKFFIMSKEKFNIDLVQVCHRSRKKFPDFYKPNYRSKLIQKYIAK